jgi:hypothetical protein
MKRKIIITAGSISARRGVTVSPEIAGKVNDAGQIETHLPWRRCPIFHSPTKQRK